jgi:3-oxoacyl-[acyl-carrier-protein] synthase-1
MGLGFAAEPAFYGTEEPLRAEGLVEALRQAFRDSRCDYDDLDYRITDNNGESYGFKDSTLLVARTLRDRKETFDIWHPVDCIGEVGAATVPVIMAVARTAADGGYAPGPGVLCHVSGDDENRAAFVLRHRLWSES